MEGKMICVSRQTHERLQQYKIRLQADLRLQMTFDQIIERLLDQVEKTHEQNQ
jgi:hypothetical protein